MKRILSFICVFVLCIALLSGGALLVRKLHTMYGNIWDTLDQLSYSVNQIEQASAQHDAEFSELAAQLDTVSMQVNHLHRQALTAEQFAYSNAWMDNVPPYIAHACGGIGDVTYTNSREAFLHNYALGQRVFEIDFNLADDGVLIASHDEDYWRSITDSTQPYTSVNFNQTPIYDQYESLNCSEVIELMAAYPDIYVVTDTKATTQAEVMLAFSQLVYCAQQTHPEVLERIIPQIYHEDMLPWITSIYSFQSVIYTLYQVRWTPESVLNFCMNSGVRFITMPLDQFNEETLQLWDTLGIQVAVHTVNDEAQAQALLSSGVDMIYTDFITPGSGADN